MHEGHWSTILGLPGWPRAGEELMVMRNIQLAELCGTRIHCQHLSSAGSVRLLRNARGRGVAITGELCPHHIALSEKPIRSRSARGRRISPRPGKTEMIKTCAK